MTLTAAERRANVAYLAKLAARYRLTKKRERRGLHIGRGIYYALHFSLRSAANRLREGKA